MTFGGGGDTTANYWHRTVTSGHFEAFRLGWNLLRFDWQGSNEVGSPAAGSVDSVRLTINYDGNAQENHRLDNIVVSNGELFEIFYYSDRLFQDVNGNYIEETSSDDDNVVLEGYSANIYIYKAAELAAQQIQEQGGSIDVQYFQQQYEKLKKRYRQEYLSSAKRRQNSYYQINRKTSIRQLR